MGVAFDGQNSVPVEFRQLHGVKHAFLVFPDQFQNIGMPHGSNKLFLF